MGYKHARSGGYPVPETIYDEPSWNTQDIQDKVTKVVFDIPVNRVYVTTCKNWFQGFSHLKSVENIARLKTDNVEYMSAMFSGCTELKELDLSANSFSSLVNTQQMFANCSSLETLKLPSFTEKMTDMSKMFDGCKALKSLDLSRFDTQNVISMMCMFNGCSALTELDLSNFNTKNVRTMSSMFSGCSALTKLNLSSFNTRSVLYMENMFNGCSALTELKLPSSFTTDRVQQMQNMFNGCSALTELDLSSFNTKNVTDMTQMFKGCANLVTIYVNSDNFKVPTSGTSMFEGCTNLKGDRAYSVDAAATDKKDGWDGTLYATTDDGYLSDKSFIRPWVKYDASNELVTFQKSFKHHLYDNEYLLNEGTDAPGWLGEQTNAHIFKKVIFDKSFDDARPTTCYQWFYCPLLESIEGIEYLHTEDVTNMSKMFHCNIKKLDVSHFNTTNVTDMSDMFNISVTSLDVSNFDTQNVTNMQGMFSGCSNLTTLDVSHFNTEKVTDMSYMFSGDSELTFIDLSSFQTFAKLDYMFNKCSKLCTIYAKRDKFQVDSRTSQDMFKDCTSLAGDVRYTNINKSDPDNVASKKYATFDGGYLIDDLESKRAWVKYNIDFRNKNLYGILTFLYNDEKLYSPYTPYNTTYVEWEYPLNKKGKDVPEWQSAENIGPVHKVVFDPSFAKFRPKTCHMWFGGNATGNYLKEIEGIQYLNTEDVTDMSEMFSHAGLTSLDLSHFDTWNVTDMSNMFNDCKGITSLDLSNFNTQNVTTMNGMFEECYGLQTIYAGRLFLTPAIKDDNEIMFSGCNNLKGATAYDESKLGTKMANYKTGYFTKLVAKVGDEKIGAVGETLTADHDMTLPDDKDLTLYETDGFKAPSISYTRSNVTGGKWASLCLPFQISMKEAQSFRAYTLLSATNDVITLQEETADIAAGTPLLIHMNEGATEININGKDVDIKAVQEGSTTKDAAYQLVGLYTTKTFDKATDNNCYIVKGDKLMNPAKMLEASDAVQKVGSRPYRAYVQASKPTAQANMLSIAINDEVTGIKAIDALNGDTPAEYYDMQGRRINGLQKGINIVKRGNKTTKVIIR